MDTHHFDYIIVGNGMAGFQLALALANDSFFNSKRIALIDKEQKLTNDKTWSFWENGKGNWDPIVHKYWNKALFYSKENLIDINLNTYTYKSIRAIDFYNHAHTILKQKANFQLIIDTVETIESSKKPKVLCGSKNYTANHVFDSRIPLDFFKQKINFIILNQHFKGIIIETPEDRFDPETFTMMDYRLQYQNATSFVYILPFSKRKALIEYTFFTPFMTNELIYDQLITEYIQRFLKISNYKTLETEKGNIPMTTFPFENYTSKQVTKIGTAGGWVKGSTGYSFKLTEKKVAKIITNLKLKKAPSTALMNKRFKFYDKIFLKVLFDENEKGPWIFTQFYKKNTVKTMFRFLDEESNFKEELRIMGSLFSWSFIKAFFKTL